MIDHLREAGLIVGHLSRALLDGTRDLKTVPGLLTRIIEEEMWREWVDPASGRPFGPFRSFPHFVAAKAKDGGLGSDQKQLLALCEDDSRARALIDWCYQNKPGRPPKTLDNIQGFPSGTSEAAALRRLRKDRTDLYDDVIAERLSAHAAMVQAGYRHPTATVPLDDPERLAATLRRRLDPDTLRQLVKLLEAAS
jgi:hypothetical protein